MSQATGLFIRSYEEILSEVNHRAGRPTSFSFDWMRPSGAITPRNVIGPCCDTSEM